jgi:hypothetical protein
MTGVEPVPLALDRVVLVTREQIVTGVSELFGLAVLAGTLAAVVAVAYRWYTREQAPLGLTMLFGLAGVAVYLNTTTALGRVISGEMNPMDAALFNIVAFLFGAAGTAIGYRTGDHFGQEVLLGDRQQDIDEEVSRLVKTVGRVTSVELPAEINDVVGYDPVNPRTKEKLAGKRFVFPRNLTVEQLRARLVSRLKTDYAVGTVDMELADDGTIDYLAVGSRAAGIGPTLPPATNAVAIRADPAFAASTGDLVQVWETDPMRRVLTAELRGISDDVVTIAISSADTPKIDPTRQYRLVTLPVDDRPEREFASLLRVADETFSSVTVEAGSPLHGMPVGALDLSIVSVKPDSEEPTALPEPAYVLAPGDVVFAIALPEALRKLETASEPLDPALVQSVGTPAPPKAPQPERGATETPPEPREPQAQPEPRTGIEQETPAETETADRPDHSGSQPTDSDTPVAEAGGGDEEAVGGKADPSKFDELKEEFESGDGWEDDESAEDDTEPVEAVAGTDDDSDEREVTDSGGAASFDELKEEYESGEGWEDDESDDDDPVEAVASGSDSTNDEQETDSSGGSSFDELKDEFESGDADWAEEEGEEEIAFKSDDTGADAGGIDDSRGDEVDETDDDLVSLEDADISFSDDDADEDDDLLGDDGLFDESDDDDDLSALDLEDDGDDDLFDDTDGDDLFEEGDDDGGDEEGEDDDEDDEEEADDDDDDSGGGGTSFAQLKDEFESGDADWEDDISDSPGGDMRLDE